VRQPGDTIADAPAPGVGPGPGGRSTLSYVLLPRPGEAWVKGWLPVIAFGVVALTGNDLAGPPLPVALAAWAVFELVLYQTRYLVNDLADAEVDRTHVAAATRGRLPAGDATRRLARASIVPRVAVGLGAALLLLPPPARGVTLAATAGLVAATVAYEAARTVVRRRRVDRATARLTAVEVAVYALVGAGYAVRIGLGAGLAGAGAALAGAAAAYGWAFGTLVVVMTWTCEAAGLLAGDGQAVLARKSHIAVLARLIGDGPERVAAPLLGGRPARLVAVLEGVATGTALVLGAGLDEAPTPIGAVALVAVCVVAGPLVVAVWPRPGVGWAAAVLALVTCLVAGGGGGVGTAAVVFCVAGPVATFRTFTPASLGLAPARTPGG